LKLAPIKRFDVGAQGDLEYNSIANRIGFITSVTDLVLTPLLHRNTIKFFGMNNSDDYLSYKVIKDKLYTLTDNNII